MSSPDHIDELWRRMTAMYGSKWPTQYGDVDDGTWRAGLRDVTPAQIGLGLQRTLTEHVDWPPTLPQFRAMCRRTRPAAHQPFKALPAPRCSGERIRSGCAELRSLLAGGSA